MLVCKIDRNAFAFGTEDAVSRDHTVDDDTNEFTSASTVGQNNRTGLSATQGSYIIPQSHELG